MIDSIKGYGLGALAAISYGMNPLFALPLYQAGLNTDSVLVYRYFFAIIIVIIMMIARGRSFRIKWSHLPLLAILGVMMALSSLALFASYRYIEASIASTIVFVYPVLVGIIMAIFFHEKLSIQTIACIAVAVIGVVMLYHGGGIETLHLGGTLLVIASALSYAIYIVGVNQWGVHDLTTLTLTFYVLCFGVLIFVGRLAVNGQPLIFPQDMLHWGCAVCLALFPTAISLLCTTGAIHYIGPLKTAILGALEPVTAVLIGVFVFSESLSGNDIVGLLMIVASVMVIVSGENISIVLLSFRKLFSVKHITHQHKAHEQRLHHHSKRAHEQPKAPQY